MTAALATTARHTTSVTMFHRRTFARSLASPLIDTIPRPGAGYQPTARRRGDVGNQLFFNYWPLNATDDDAFRLLRIADSVRAAVVRMGFPRGLGLRGLRRRADHFPAETPDVPWVGGPPGHRG